MTPHEIFRQMPREHATQIFSYLFEKEKALYKATIDALATQRKVRPVFAERKPREERYAWMKESLGRKPADAVAAHLLQVWLVGQHPQLLCAFLDGLGINHDEKGTIDQLPPPPARQELEAVIDHLLTQYDPTIVSIYLHSFQALDESGWPVLADILKDDVRLRLGAPPPTV